MEFPAALNEAPTEIQTVVSFGETSRSLDETTRIPTNPDPHPIRAEAGLVLRNRYRLEELLVQREETQTWLAFDEMLARPVRVHLMPADRPNKALLAAARRAAVASDYRFLRVLDATIPKKSEIADTTGIGPYIVCEYASGQTLEDLLAKGPLSTLEAAWLVREVADALVGMHARKLYHQRLSPTTVVVTTDGTVKIVGFLLEAEMTPSPRKVRDPEAADVQALGRLLFSTLTGRWLGDHDQVAPLTDSEGHVLTPKQVDARVSPALDQICDRILNPSEHADPLATAVDISSALSGVLGTADATLDLEKRVQRPAYHSPATVVQRVPSATPETAPARVTAPAAPRKAPASRKPSTPRTTRVKTSKRTPRWGRVLVALVPLAVAGVLIGGAVGLNPPADGGPAPVATQKAAPAAGPSEQLPVVAAKDFDPEGNGEERPQQTSLAWDGDPKTSWRTMDYWESDIGNKSGVGLVFDLGEVRQISRVELVLDGNGTSLEVRVPATGADNASQSAPNSVAQWNVVGQAQRTPSDTSITLDQPVRTRFVLVYLTDLPRDGAAFTGGIAEARFWS